jgi:hypothetical protein
MMRLWEVTCPTRPARSCERRPRTCTGVSGSSSVHKVLTYMMCVASRARTSSDILDDGYIQAWLEAHEKNPEASRPEQD